MWRLVAQICILFISTRPQNNTVSASCSRPYALKRPNPNCFPALDSTNQNTITSKSNCIRQKAEMKLKVYNIMEFLWKMLT